MLSSPPFFRALATAALRRGRLLLLLLLLLLGAASAGADAATPARPAPALLPPAPGPAPRLRLPNEARLRELRGRRAFQYADDARAPEQSAWEAFWARVREAIGRWLASRSYNGFWRWIFYALFVGAAVFVVLRLLEIDFTTLLGRAPRRAPLAYDTTAENIHEVDFATRLAEAEAAGNWRLAVRLGYLQLLKTLADNDLIAWQPDKTNHAYLAELPAAGPLRTAFREATRQFEYVWYGELLLSPTLYAEVRAGHRALREQLGRPSIPSPR